MRYGTFLCWAFGHKFIGKEITFREDKSHPSGYRQNITTINTKMCFRCGVEREKKS